MCQSIAVTYGIQSIEYCTNSILWDLTFESDKIGLNQEVESRYSLLKQLISYETFIFNCVYLVQTLLRYSNGTIEYIFEI